MNRLNPLGNMPIAPSIFSSSSFTQTNEGGDKNGATHKSVPNFKVFNHLSMTNMVGGNIDSSKVDDLSAEMKPTTAMNYGENKTAHDNKALAGKSLIPRQKSQMYNLISQSKSLLLKDLEEEDESALRTPQKTSSIRSQFFTHKFSKENILHATGDAAQRLPGPQFDQQQWHEKNMKNLKLSLEDLLQDVQSARPGGNHADAKNADHQKEVENRKPATGTAGGLRRASLSAVMINLENSQKRKLSMLQIDGVNHFQNKQDGVKEEQDLEDLNDSAYDEIKAHKDKNSLNLGSNEDGGEEEQNYKYEDLDVDIVDNTDYEYGCDDMLANDNIQKKTQGNSESYKMHSAIGHKGSGSFDKNDQLNGQQDASQAQNKQHQYRSSSNQVTIQEIRGQLNYEKKQKELRKSFKMDPTNKLWNSQNEGAQQHTD